MEGQPSAPAHSFVDVTDESQNTAVSWMSHNKITTGTSETTFAPDTTLTRAHLVTFLHRLAGEPEAPAHPFNDVHKDWQRNSVSWASHTEITTGTSATTFEPDQTLTRAHLVTFLWRYQDKPDVTVDPDTPLCDPEAEAAAAAVAASHVELSSVPDEATAVAYGGQVSVSWPATEALAGSPAPGYEVQWAGPGEVYDESRRAVVIGLSFAVSGLSDGVVYALRVRPAVVEKAEVAGASIIAAQGTAPTATLGAPPVPLDETRDVSAFDGAVDFEMTGEQVWPATIEIPVDMAKIEDDDFVFLMSFNEEYQIWLPEPGAVFDRERGIVTAEVYHLSSWSSFKSGIGNAVGKVKNVAVAAHGVVWDETEEVRSTVVEYTVKSAKAIGSKVVYGAEKAQDGARFFYDTTRDGVMYVTDKGYTIAVSTYTTVRDAAFATARAAWEAAKFIAAMGWQAFVALVEEWVDKFTTSLPICSNTEPEWVSSVEVPERGAPLVVCPETVAVDGEPDLRLKVTADRRYPLLLTARDGSGRKIKISTTDDRERIRIEKSEGSSPLGDVAIAWLDAAFDAGEPVLSAGATHWLRIPRSALMDQLTLTLEGEYDGAAANLNTAMLGIDLLADIWEIPTSSDIARLYELRDEASECSSRSFSATSSEEQRIGSFNETTTCLVPLFTQALASKVLQTLLSPVLFLLEGIFQLKGYQEAAQDIATGQATPKATIHAEPNEDTTNTNPPPTSTFKAVIAGSNHWCGLRSDNTVECWGWGWGYNDSGRTDAPAGSFKTVSASSSHSCGLRSDNTITCWGDDYFGRTDAPAGSFKTVSAGETHSCGLRSDNTITCWGYNDSGRTDAPAGSFKTVSAGGAISCGLRSDNTITCWGDNRYGQTDAPAGSFKTVSAGWFHSCGLRSDNTITCWGADYLGRTDAPAGSFKTVSAGGFHSCGLHSDNTIICWGEHVMYGLAYAPAGSFKTVSAGWFHSCGLRSDNTITCWGADYLGRTDAPAGSFKTVSAGYAHSCGLRSDNTITCWGADYLGRTDAPAGSFKTVSAGGSISCGLRSDNTVECWGWGYNRSGQTDAPAGSFGPVNNGGSSDDRTVTVTKGGLGPTQLAAGHGTPCAPATPTCRYLNIELNGFAPGTYTVSCHHDGWLDSGPSKWWDFSLTVDATGTATIGNQCFINFADLTGNGAFVNVNKPGTGTVTSNSLK